jgi:hypothetical protein
MDKTSFRIIESESTTEEFITQLPKIEDLLPWKNCIH